jgi:hypothetical protein
MSIVFTEEFPALPPAAVLMPAKGAVVGLPRKPGVYFIWSGDRLLYVGQSHHLYNRVRRDRHIWLKAGMGVSWVEVRPHDLIQAEAFYISTGQPARNKRGFRRVVDYLRVERRGKKWWVISGNEKKLGYSDQATAESMLAEIRSWSQDS